MIPRYRGVAVRPICTIAAVFAAALPSLAQERPALAVLDLAVVDRSPISDPAGTRAALVASGKTPAAWMQEAFASYGAYRVVDAAGSDCAAASCALAAGKQLSASRVVYGTIIKVSRLIWYADAALVDVAAGKVLRSEELEIKGDIAQILPRAMPSMARRLAAADPLLAQRHLDRKRLTAEQV